MRTTGGTQGVGRATTKAVVVSSIWIFVVTYLHRPDLRQPHMRCHGSMPDDPRGPSLRDVSLHFGETPALDHVSFEMDAGETRVVLGAAGSGKTMLLKTALGLVKPDSGRIFCSART